MKYGSEAGHSFLLMCLLSSISQIASLPAHQPANMSIYVYTSFLDCLSACLSICLSACLSVCMPACLSVPLLACLPAYLPACLLAWLYVPLLACLPVYLFIHLSIAYPPVCLLIYVYACSDHLWFCIQLPLQIPVIGSAIKPLMQPELDSWCVNLFTFLNDIEGAAEIDQIFLTF